MSIPGLLLLTLPCGALLGVAVGWRRGTAASVAGGGLVGGAVAGLVVSVLAELLPGVPRGFNLIGPLPLGAMLGGLLGLVTAGVGALVRRAGRVRPSVDPPAA